MKLQLIHLSDMHFEDRTHPFEIQIDKIIQAINSIENADECIIVVSGDLSGKGASKEYNYVSSFLGALFKHLNQQKYLRKKIEFVCVPGNHDIDFTDMSISFSDIKRSYKDGKIEELVEIYLNNMNGFYGFAKYKRNFLDDKIVSKKVVSYDDKKVGFILLNTAPLSVLGGNAEDMGNHYFTDAQMAKIEQATEADINILVMHHSIEWFNSACKDRLRKIISQKYSLILTGHEHEPVGESRNINGFGEVQCVQGNALYGYTADGNGFCTVNIDIQNNDMVGYSFLWNGSIYVPKKIIDRKIKNCFGGFLTVKNEFLEDISRDNYKREIDGYYVFPSFTYNTFKENDEIEKHDIETENEFLETLSKYNKIVITGENKSGKTVLAKRLFKHFLSEGKIPIFITASDINKKRIEKTIEFVFAEQYETENDAYEMFKQISISNKIVLLDEANLINKSVMGKLLAFLEDNFEKVILFSEEMLDLNIRQQVVDAMMERNTLNLTIKPFLYVKRKN